MMSECLTELTCHCGLCSVDDEQGSPYEGMYYHIVTFILKSTIYSHKNTYPPEYDRRFPEMFKHYINVNSILQLCMCFLYKNAAWWVGCHHALWGKCT